MNCLSLEKRKQIVHLLIEGNSIRGTARLADVQKNTVLKLLTEIGEACMDYHNEHMRNLKCKTIEVDEIWSFIQSKEKNIPHDKKHDALGTVWTWTAIDADTRLAVSWHIGGRDLKSAKSFIGDLHGRLAGRVQITSDGHHPYIEAIEQFFGNDVDYGIVEKIYAPNGKYISSRKKIITGMPIHDKISTSYVERQNLTMRMSIKRMARKTNAFSKNVHNHGCAIALHFFYYNFCRIHSTLRVTPAMAAGISDRVWDIEDIICKFA